MSAALIIIVLPIVIFVLIIFVAIFYNSKQKKKMRDLAGQVNKQGEGVIVLGDKSVNVCYFPGSRNRSPEFKVYTTGTFGTSLAIRRETSVDTFFVKIGLNKEVPISDQGLADKFYFECDVPEFLDRLLSNPEAKLLITDILNKFDFIEITPTKCTFRKYPFGSFDSISKDFINESAQQLLKFISIVPASVLLSHREVDSFKMWSSLWNFIGIITLIAGFGLFIWATLFPVVNEGKAWVLAAECFAAVFSTAIYLAFLTLKGFSTSSRAFLIFLGCFGIGSLLCIRYGGGVYNGLYDTSAAVKFEPIVVNKYTTTSKRTTNYHITVMPWHQGMSGWSIPVSQGEYAQVRTGETKCFIVTKSGRLGFEWLVFQRVELSGRQSTSAGRYDQWYPLPANTGHIPPEEYLYWQKWHVIMEEGIDNRMLIQKFLDGFHFKEEYIKFETLYEYHQKKMLEKLKALEAPGRLESIKDEIFNAGIDQIEFYREYATIRAANSFSRFNDSLNNAYLRASDEKLHAADNYFKSLYPTIDKATNDAVERRIAWFDIV